MTITSWTGIIFIILMVINGCSPRNNDAVILSAEEITILEKYYESYEKCELAVKICFKHHLKKQDVIKHMGRVMRTEVEERKIYFLWRPSEILTLSFNENSELISADMGEKKFP